MDLHLTNMVEKSLNPRLMLNTLTFSGTSLVEEYYRSGVGVYNSASQTDSRRPWFVPHMD